jgi:hypothetical protein
MQNVPSLIQPQRHLYGETAETPDQPNAESEARLLPSNHNLHRVPCRPIKANAPRKRWIHQVSRIPHTRSCAPRTLV